MRRVLMAGLGLLLMLISGPPLWYALFPPEPPPDLPPAGRRVELPGGVGLNVLESGAGPAVVLVHGLPGTGYDWRVTRKALAARGLHAVAYDRVGYGRSDARLDTERTPEANSEELLQLLDALGLARVTVVGWSYGGLVGMLAAERAPARMARLVLVGTAGPDAPNARPPAPSAAMRFLYSMPVLRWRQQVPPIGRGLMAALSARAFSGGPQPSWWMDELRANFARWETVLSYRDEMFAYQHTALDPGAIAMPTLLVHGDDDRLAPVSISRYLHTAIPGSTLVEVPGGSHMLPITHADLLADRIAAFVEGP